MSKKTYADNQPETATRGNYTPNNSNEPILVGIQTCLEMVFPDIRTRPSFRTFNEWKQRRYFESVKIGKRVFLDPVKVRASLERRFEIQAFDVQ